jgi:FkbM family methyltransferase
MPLPPTFESVRRLVRDNSPARKPQLWEHLGRAISRRFQFEIGTRFDRSWLDTPRVVSILGGDVSMKVIPRDAIGKGIFLYGVFEQAVTRFFQSVLTPGATFVDVGANRGYYTLLAARQVGSHGRVIAFEPVPSLFEDLRSNVERNAFRNVETRQIVVWRSEGEVPFFDVITPENSGLSTTVASAGRTASRMVKATTLDSLQREVGRLDVVKIDVEGGEGDVFAGAREVLASADAPLLVFEAFQIDTVLPGLEQNSYLVRRLAYSTKGGLRLLDPRGHASSTDGVDSYEAPNYVAISMAGTGAQRWPILANLL